MPTYEIEAPNGQILEIDGATMPTEQELDDIFKQTNTNTQQPMQEQPKAKKGIDLTPSGLINKASSVSAGAVATPFLMLKDGLGVKDAYNKAMKNQQEWGNNMPSAVKTSGNISDFMTDMAVYGSIPGVNIGSGLLGKAGSYAINNGLVNAGIGTLEALKEGKNPVEGALLGGTIGLGTPLIFKGVGKGISKTLNNPTIQNGLTTTMSYLTSVPKEYLDIALKSELAGNSLFNKAFNPKTAYQPIEQKINDAKSALPTSEQFAEQYRNLGINVGKRLNETVKPLSFYEEQYKNLGNQLKNKLDSTLRPQEYFDNLYYQYGNDAIRNRDFVENSLNGDLFNVLNDKLNNRKIAKDINIIKNEIKSVISGFGAGGSYNSAETYSKKLLNDIDNFVNTKNLTMRDLHRFKEDLYDLGYQADAVKQGTTAKVARGTANKINNYLRNNAKGYAQANDNISKFIDAENRVGGINPTTIASKLRDYGNSAQTLNGFNQNYASFENTYIPKDMRILDKIKSLNDERIAQETLSNSMPSGILNDISKYDTLPYENQEIISRFAPNEVNTYKNLSLQQGIENKLQNDINPFVNDISKYDKASIEQQNALEQFAPDELNQYKQLLNLQNTQNEILNPISGQQYLRNPKLLLNRNDIGAENALNYLQEQSGINFMDDLNKVRATETMNKWFPGQGGGSGSDEGFGNLLRTSIIGGVPTASVVSHNPLALLGLGLVSPKINAKGTVQNLGRLNRVAEAMQNSPLVEKLLTPLMIKSTVPLLEGGVQYYENR